MYGKRFFRVLYSESVKAEGQLERLNATFPMQKRLRQKKGNQKQENGNWKSVRRQ